jgi:hypothetical protein
LLEEFGADIKNATTWIRENGGAIRDWAHEAVAGLLRVVDIAARTWAALKAIGGAISGFGDASGLTGGEASAHRGVRRIVERDAVSKLGHQITTWIGARLPLLETPGKTRFGEAADRVSPAAQTAAKQLAEQQAHRRLLAAIVINTGRGRPVVLD